MQPNEALKVEAEDVRDIPVFLTDVEPRAHPQGHRFRPVGGTNIYKVIVETKSGQEFSLEVSWHLNLNFFCIITLCLRRSCRKCFRTST